MEIRKYGSLDEQELMDIIEAEGNDWICYWGAGVSAKYRAALARSITYVALVDGRIVGYVRALDDCGFYIYVCDLLVAPAFRGHSIGRALLSRCCDDYPGHDVYVMSDADGYYEKQDCIREGSVFRVALTKNLL